MLRAISILLLLFNGIGAIYGGWLFMIDPSGVKIGMSLSYLQHSPFTNYFIPGIILFIANGLLSFLIAMFVLFKWKYYTRLITLQGIVLIIWLIVQIMMIDLVYFLHFIMGVVGIMLTALGIILSKKNKQLITKN